ncbi:MAG: DUF2950 domain-containing protein [Candidatus Acidiferrales bacterium]
MSTRSKNIVIRVTVLAALIFALSSVSLQSQPRSVSKSGAGAPPQTTQTGFATPQEAAAALIKAAGDYDPQALNAMFGPDGEDFVSTADPVQDKNQAAAFAERAQQKNSVVVDPKNPNQATILVGEEEWPFPVPLVRKGAKWYFDSKTGHDQIVYERIGANELDAIQVCRGFVEAQEQYASEVHDDSGINQYAQRTISTDGKQDGLAWKNPDGTWAGPVSETVAKAIEQGYTTSGQPFHGYYFKVLKGQGPAAPNGELDYVINGVMIGGFALVAWPAEYKVTGVQTFIVSYSGIVYQKDLGPDTAKIAAAMERYNPDKTWHPTDDNW